MTKNTLIALFAVMACCTAADGPRETMPIAAAVQLRMDVGNDATTVGPDRTPVGAVPERGGVRSLGAEGVFYLLLAAFGASALALAGFLLIGPRRGGRDAPGLVLGGAGYVMLIVAAFGLLMLNQ